MHANACHKHRWRGLPALCRRGPAAALAALLATGCGGGGSSEPAAAGSAEAGQGPLVLVAHSPAAGASGVPADTAITLEYSQPLVAAPTVVLSGPSNKPVDGTLEVSGARVTFRPGAALLHYQEYGMQVYGGQGVSGAVPAAAGQAVAWRFRTEPSATLPAIDFDAPPRLAFSGARSSDIPPQTIGIVNAGAGTLGGLRVGPVDYEKQPAWLQRTFIDSPAAPAQLEIKVNPALLEPGRYAVWVPVVGDAATNHGARVLVELEVLP
jgi:hypothetical protein